MTVAHIYWRFDVMAAHLRVTNPFGSGSGDGSSSTSSGGAPVPPGSKFIEHKSGFALEGSLLGARVQRARGIKTYKTIAEVRAANPDLADLIEDYEKGEFD